MPVVTEGPFNIDDKAYVQLAAASEAFEVTFECAGGVFFGFAAAQPDVNTELHYRRSDETRLEADGTSANPAFIRAVNGRGRYWKTWNKP